MGDVEVNAHAALRWRIETTVREGVRKLGSAASRPFRRPSDVPDEIRIHPAPPRLVGLAAEAARRLKDPVAFRAFLESDVPQTLPKDAPWGMFLQGVRAFDGGDLALASSCFEAFLTDHAQALAAPQARAFVAEIARRKASGEAGEASAPFWP